MTGVVALALPGGSRFVDELKRAWDDGDAVAPIDTRLPAAAFAAAIQAVNPTVIVDYQGRRDRPGRPAAEGDALIICTSGTSGEPRAAVLTHDAVAAGATATSVALGVDPDSDRWLACLPLSHVGGLSVVTRAILTGTSLEVHDGFRAGAVEQAARDGATLVSLVATAAQRIDATLFRSILLGGSAIPPDRPTNCVATYGLTETGGGVVYDGIPLDGVEVREVDGELQIRCPMLLRQYRDGSNPTNSDGWFPTGDGGHVDDGLVRVDGRLGDVIVTGGEKVWPDPVERLLGADPSVAEVAVIGRPDNEWGDVVTAVIVPADPNQLPNLDHLRDVVKEQLPTWCAPKRLEIVEELPRTALGKVKRSLI